MAQQLVSPSNCSINQNILRLNSSSCCLVSPESCTLGTSFKSNLLQFQQFRLEEKTILTNNNPNKDTNFPQPSTSIGLGKKKLTIQIDDQCSPSQEIDVIQIASPTETTTKPTYNQLVQKVRLLEQKYENQHQALQKLTTECTIKDNKIKKIQKMNEKLMSINKQLVRQVKINERKVLDLQKQLQNKVYAASQENIHRLKQSSFKIKEKENYQRFNGNNLSNTNNNKPERDSIRTQHTLNTTKEKQFGFSITQNLPGGRKSLERKKTLQASTTSAGQLTQVKKAGKITSSSSSNTILSKKLMHK